MIGKTIDNRQFNKTSKVIIGLIILLFSFYIGNIKFPFYHTLMVIVKASISLVVYSIVLKNGNDEIDNTLYIASGFLFANIFQVLHVMYAKEPIKSEYFLMTLTIIETISIYLAIKNISNKKNKKYNFKNITTGYSVVAIGAVVLFLIEVNVIKTHLNPNMLIESYKIIYILNFVISIISFIKICNCEGEKNHCAYMKSIVALRIIDSIVLFSIIQFNIDTINLEIITHFLYLIQVYLIYTMMVGSKIINPYIDIMEKIKIIDSKNKDLEKYNERLERIIDIKRNLQEQWLYQDEYLNTILESNPSGWLILNKDYEVEACNKTIRDIFDCDKEQLKEVSELKIKNYEQVQDAFARAYESTEDVVVEVYLVNGDIHSLFIKPMKITQTYVCISLDITKEKYISNKIMVLNKGYEDLIKSIRTPVIIRTTHIKSNEIKHHFNSIVKINDSYEKLFSLSDSYISKEGDKKLIDNEYFINNIIYEADRELYREVLVQNEKALTNEEMYNGGIARYRILDKNKNITWVESKTTIFYEGKTKYTIISYNDVTDFVKMEENLKKSEDVYKKLLNKMPEGIYLEDLDTNEYIYINEKFKDMFKLKENKTSGLYRSDYMKIPSDYISEINNALEKVKKEQISSFAEIQVVDNNNDIIDIRTASIPFKIKDKTLKLTILDDIREIKKAEELKNQIRERIEYDKMKIEFFVNISHELKTPLNLIFSSIQLMESLYNKEKLGDFNNVLKRHLKLTKQNSFRLLKIINDIIDISKLESGFYKVNMINENIIEVVEDIALSMVSFAKEKGIDILFDTDNEEKYMDIDLSMIERIVLNIISNAIKFTDEGGSIYVDLYDKDDFIQIKIKDTGAGIPEDMLDKIFDRFNQVNHEARRNVEGSGIGLSMVKYMIKLLDGTISVNSKLNEGTEFIINLPVVENEYFKDHRIERELHNVAKLTVEMTDIYK